MSRMDIFQAIDNLERDILRVGQSRGTATTYVRNLGRFVRAMTIKRTGEITIPLIRAYENLCLDQGVSHRSINSYLDAIKALLRWLDDNGHQIIDLRKIRRHREAKPIVGSMTLEQALSVIAVVTADTIYGYRDRALVWFLFSTGCRISEAVNMNRNDVDTTNNEAYIHHGKGDKGRVVFLNPQACHAIDEYLDLRTDDYPVLFMNHNQNAPHDKRVTPRSLQNKMHNFGVEAGLKFNLTPHVWRRSAATFWHYAGVKLKHIQEALGHVKTQTTLNYIKTDRNAMKKDFTKAFNLVN